MKKLILALFLIIPEFAGAQTASFATSKDRVCRDSCITFINTSTGSVDNIKWFIPGDSITHPQSDTIIVCFQLSGLDTVKLYVFGSGWVDSTTQIVRIKQMPYPMLIDTLPSFNGMPCGLYVPDIYTT